MSAKDFPLGPSYTNNPLTHNIYYEDLEEGIIAPGTAKILATEDLIPLATENGILLTTEGV